MHFWLTQGSPSELVQFQHNLLDGDLGRSVMAQTRGLKVQFEFDNVIPIDRERLRIPPHSLEAESSLLGALLLDNDAWDQIDGMVTAGDFYRSEHRQIFQALIALISADKPADVVTVYEELRSSGEGSDCGGLPYLNQLAQYVPSAGNIKRYAELVRERAILRKLIAVGDQISASGFNQDGKSVAALLDEAEKKVFKIGEEGSRLTKGFHFLEHLVADLIAKVEERADNPVDVTGLRSGFYDLDRMTSGLQAGDLVILAARPSMGKTSFAINIAEHVAINEEKPVAVFSMEMGAEQLAVRIVGSIGRINQSHIRTGRLLDEEWPRLVEAIDRLKGVKLHIDETPGLTLSELRSNARRLARMNDGKLGLIVIDYLQLMTTSAGSNEENRATALGEISRGLKMLAKELA